MSRNEARGRSLADEMECSFTQWQSWNKLDVDLVINATPVGMGGGSETLIADASWIRPDQCFFEFVYHPRRTPFLETAAGRGASTVDGLALLVSQAAQSFRLWTGESFDVGEMASALEESGDQV